VDAVRRAPEIALSDLDVSAELRARSVGTRSSKAAWTRPSPACGKRSDADPQNAAAYDHLGTLLVQQAKLDEGVGPELERGAVG
jgi:hypothetical protein